MRFCIEYDGKRVQKLRRSWRSACDAAKLGKDVTPHTLRHTSVTWRLLAGGKIWDVAHYVGMSEKMVRDNYGHHSPDFLKEQRDAI
jgi:integrase